MPLWRAGVRVVILVSFVYVPGVNGTAMTPWCRAISAAASATYDPADRHLSRPSYRIDTTVVEVDFASGPIATRSINVDCPLLDLMFSIAIAIAVLTRARGSPSDHSRLHTTVDFPVISRSASTLAPSPLVTVFWHSASCTDFPGDDARALTLDLAAILAHDA